MTTKNAVVGRFSPVVEVGLYSHIHAHQEQHHVNCQLNDCGDDARRKRARAHGSCSHARADANAVQPLCCRAGADDARRERADGHERCSRACGDGHVSPALGSPLR
jgi:hypothetical protein